MPHDPDLAVWLAAPQQHLLQLTAGDVFRDDPGELTRRRRTYRPYPKCFGHGFAALPVSGSLGPLLDEALADPPVQRRDGPLQQALQQLAAAHNDLHVSESVEPLIGYFELGVNDATRPTRSSILLPSSKPQ